MKDRRSQRRAFARSKRHITPPGAVAGAAFALFSLSGVLNCVSATAVFPCAPAMALAIPTEEKGAVRKMPAGTLFRCAGAVYRLLPSGGKQRITYGTALYPNDCIIVENVEKEKGSAEIVLYFTRRPTGNTAAGSPIPPGSGNHVRLSPAKSYPAGAARISATGQDIVLVSLPTATLAAQRTDLRQVSDRLVGVLSKNQLRAIGASPAGTLARGLDPSTDGFLQNPQTDDALVDCGATMIIDWLNRLEENTPCTIQVLHWNTRTQDVGDLVWSSRITAATPHVLLPANTLLPDQRYCWKLIETPETGDASLAIASSIANSRTISFGHLWTLPNKKRQEMTELLADASSFVEKDDTGKGSALPGEWGVYESLGLWSLLSDAEHKAFSELPLDLAKQPNYAGCWKRQISFRALPTSMTR